MVRNARRGREWPKYPRFRRLVEASGLYTWHSDERRSINAICRLSESFISKLSVIKIQRCNSSSSLLSKSAVSKNLQASSKDFRYSFSSRRELAKQLIYCFREKNYHCTKN